MSNRSRGGGRCSNSAAGAVGRWVAPSPVPVQWAGTYTGGIDAYMLAIDADIIFKKTPSGGPFIPRWVAHAYVHGRCTMAGPKWAARVDPHVLLRGRKAGP